MFLKSKLKNQAIQIYDALNSMDPKETQTFLLNYDSGNVEEHTPFMDKKNLGYQFSVLASVSYSKETDTYDIRFNSPVKKG